MSDIGHKDLPPTGFVRLPAVLAVFPVSKSTWWAGVKSGKFPPPVKLSERCTAWRVADIRQLLSDASASPKSSGANPVHHPGLENRS